MSYISKHIVKINEAGKKALSVFITAGFPNQEKFLDAARHILDEGADLLEIGIPFSDPLADGSVIQAASQTAIENGMNLEKTLKVSEILSKEYEQPIILMGYANPIIKFGKEEFVKSALECNVKGIIIPDIPLEEYDDFFEEKFNGLDTILLTTPTSSINRIKQIDEKSSGFLYCVSVTGTTGVRQNFDNNTLSKLESTYKTISKNKMLIGFGISKPDDIIKFSPYCDGVIVGSAVVKSIENDSINFSNTKELIKSLKEVC